MPTVEIEYIKADSFIHKLHPLSKLIFELVIFAIASVFNAPLYTTIIILSVIVIIRVAKIPFKKFRYMRYVLYIVLFLIFTQGIWFTSFGDYGDIGTSFEWHTLFHLWPAWAPGGPKVPFVLEGAIYGFSLGLRMVVITLAFPILIITTHPSDLVTFLADIRIGKWRIPYSLIFVLTSGLRYIPTVSREFDNTIDAQRSRGVRFEGYNIINQVRASLPLFVPVLTSSLVKAQDLTIALESRAFGAPVERTFVREVKWSTMDWIVSIALIIIAIACFVAVQ